MNASKKRKVSHKDPVQDKRPRQESDSESRSSTPREATPEQDGGAEEANNDANDDAPKTFKELVWSHHPHGYSHIR